MLQSIQSRLVALMLALLGAVLGVNLFIFLQSQSMMHRIDRVFVSNVSIMELTEALDDVQDNVYEYLNTRSSASLENFYRNEQSYRDLCGELNDRISENRFLMLEKNIRSMSDTYLSAAEQAVQAKRGRNVEEYRSFYGEAERLHGYIHAYVYELNQLRFEQNAENYQVLMAAMRRLEALSLVLIASVFLFALFLSVMVIRQMIGPLRSLAQAADRVAAGDLEVEVSGSSSRDEVGVVTNAFGEMLRSIREYIIRQRTAMETEARMKETELSMQAHLKEAQLKYLQAQINPHFLFNSLNAGSQLAVMEGAGRTEDFLARMADFFRYNVRKTEGDATLAEEVSAVDNYIYILNVRFSGQIHYRAEMAENIDPDSIRMPSMILQPIVENAVQHGIHEDREHGRINLYVEYLEGADNVTGLDCICITVADNGAGMTREQLQSIMRAGGEDAGKPADEARSAQSGSTGIAMGNVRSRLELYYNMTDLFSVWSDGPGCGTEVTVLLPCENKRAEGGKSKEQ